MEAYIFKYLSRIFSFAQNLLAVAGLNKRTLAYSISEKTFAVEFATFGVLLFAAAQYATYSPFIETGITKVLAATILQILVSVVTLAISLLISVKIFKKSLQTDFLWRVAIIGTAFFFSFSSIIYFLQTGLQQIFEVFYVNFEHDLRAHRILDVLIVALYGFGAVYLILFSYKLVSVVSDVHEIGRVLLLYLAVSVLGLALTPLYFPIYFVAYSIMGIGLDDWTLVIDVMTAQGSH